MSVYATSPPPTAALDPPLLSRSPPDQEPPAGPAATQERDIERALERPIRCGMCEAPITTEEQAVAIAGHHRHRRTNPAGIEFEFGCFAGAPGVSVQGEPTAEATWFPPHQWSFAMCGRCGSHLGWQFFGPERFFALILARLVWGGGSDLPS